MNQPQAKWFFESETNMEDPAINQEWQMKSTHLSGDKIFFPIPFCTESPCPYFSFSTSTGILPEASQTGFVKPAIQFKDMNDWSSYASCQKTTRKASSSSASTNMISFGDSKLSSKTSNQQNEEPNFMTIKAETEEMLPLGNISFSSPPISESSIGELYGAIGYDEKGKRRGGSGARTSSQAQEHVLAERKRREKLTRQFIALSSLIPGLEKLDKSSILGGAIKYIREIEEQKKRKYDESAVSSKRHRFSSYDGSSSSDENFDSCSLESPPKIEVRISDENVVFIIDCKEHEGIIEEISRETNKLHLRVISTSSMPLGNNKLLITILAKMDEGFSMTAKDLANNIQLTILNLI